MLPLATTVTLDNFTWETGKQLMDVEVTLGSAEKSSSCKVVLSDLDHTIAEACINHAIEAGGIQPLEGTDSKKVNTPSILGAKEERGTGKGPSKGWASPEQHAFADMVAWKETQAAKDGDFAKSYLARNGGGDMPASVLLPGAGFPPTQPGGNNLGRYQFNKGDWQDAVRAGYAKDFTPEDQDGIARYKFDKVNRGGKELRAGDFEAARDKANDEWKSVPGPDSSQVQAGTTKAEYKQYYETQLAKYKTGASKVATPPAAKQASTPSTSDNGKPVIKGSVITVNINGYAFEFFHQGTEMSEDGKTILTGQGLRWLMSRRQRSRTIKDIKLSALAKQVAKEHKVTLSYQATLDPAYSHLDQSGMSDYALLIREAEAVGLMVTEDMTKKTLVVKDRAALGKPTYTLERGVNLISYKIADKALSGSEQDISTNEPNTNKVTIDPVAGKHVHSKPEVMSGNKDKITKVDAEALIKANPFLDAEEKRKIRAAVGQEIRNYDSNTTTGKVKAKVSGTASTGDSVRVSISSGQTKRIAGLPATFVVPLSSSTLEFSPLTTMLTEGFPGCLDRIWVVKTVTHSVSSNTSTLVLNSPVEVKNTGTDPSASAPGKTLSGVGLPWVYPCNGTVTSIQQANRNGRPHKGCDIANVDGTPVYAVDSGVVSRNEFEAGGAGNWLQIRHDSGLYTSYFHLLEPSTLTTGTRVLKGDQIAKMGNTGGSMGTHLHFEVAVKSAGGNIQVSKLFPDMGDKGTTITALKSVT